MTFWKTKKLVDMSLEEWESLCDGCGKCCLNKLEDEDTGEIFLTNVVCDLIDLTTCRCTRYQERTRLVPECVDLKQSTAWTAFDWMPETCAYRLLAIGEELPDWHPLVSGNRNSVHEACISITRFAVKESEVDDLEDHVIDWL